MVFSRTSKSKQINQIGLSLSPEGIALARLNNAGEKPLLTTCQFYPVQKRSEYTRVLSELVMSHALEGAQVVCVLSPDMYELFLIEAPEVSDAELGGAVRWRVKDYIEYGIDEAVIDYMPLPGRSHDVKGSMGYAVVARHKHIDELAQLTKSANLVLSSVDIAEAAMCQVAKHMPANEEGMVFVRLAPDASQLIVLKKGTISLMRNIDIHRQFLFNEAGAENDTDRDKLVADIVLEVQRSLDYCTTNLQQETVHQVVLAPANDMLKIATKDLSEELGAPAHIMQFDEVVAIDGKMSVKEQGQCFLALGAAFRALEEGA